MIKYLLVFGSGLGAVMFLTPRIRKFSLKKRLVDKRDHRKAHKKVVTRLGGIAIYLAFTMAMGLAFLLERGPAMKEFVGEFIAMLAGGTIILALGIYDDIRGADAPKKFSMQIIAALILIVFGFKIAIVTNPFSQTIELGFLAIPLTILWIVGITNAINIIDGVDGLAAGVVVIVSSTLFLVSLPQGNVPLAFLSAALAGTTLGFLKYNFSPAKLFMGDTGSMFLGFILAAMAIEGNRKSTVAVALLIPIIALGVPIIDTILAIIRRVLKGAHIFRADNEHIHHRLLHLGLSHKQVTLILYFITILLGLVAFACTLLKDKYAALLLMVIALIVVVAVRKLGLIKFSLVKRIKQQGGENQGKAASIQLIPTFKKVLKAGAWIAIAVLIMFLFKVWNSSFDRVEHILSRPGEYEGKEIAVLGRMRSAFSLPFVGSIYKIDDGTGTIWVVSRLDYVPAYWFLYMEATVEPRLNVREGLIDEKIWSKAIGSQPLGPILYEMKRAPIWASLNSFGRHVAGSLSTYKKKVKK